MSARNRSLKEDETTREKEESAVIWHAARKAEHKFASRERAINRHDDGKRKGGRSAGGDIPDPDRVHMGPQVIYRRRRREEIRRGAEAVIWRRHLDSCSRIVLGV